MYVRELAGEYSSAGGGDVSVGGEFCALYYINRAPDDM